MQGNLLIKVFDVQVLNLSTTLVANLRHLANFLLTEGKLVLTAIFTHGVAALAAVRPALVY